MNQKCPLNIFNINVILGFLAVSPNEQVPYEMDKILYSTKTFAVFNISVHCRKRYSTDNPGKKNSIIISLQLTKTSNILIVLCCSIKRSGFSVFATIAFKLYYYFSHFSKNFKKNMSKIKLHSLRSLFLFQAPQSLFMQLYSIFNSSKFT